MKQLKHSIVHYIIILLQYRLSFNIFLMNQYIKFVNVISLFGFENMKLCSVSNNAGCRLFISFVLLLLYENLNHVESLKPSNFLIYFTYNVHNISLGGQRHNN